jgi:hypothetical protein
MTRPPARALAIAAALLLAMAPTAFAKEDAVGVRLDTAIPTDLEAGQEFEIAFTMTVSGPEGETPYNADPVSLRVMDQRGAFVDVLASRDGPGHYIGTLTVPAEGLGRIYVTLPSDGPAPMSWDLYAADPVVRTAADPASIERGSPPAPITGPLAWLVVVGVAIALAAGAAAVITGRRRDDAGTSPTRA